MLTDKKSRGIFGEVNLHQILSSVFGEKNDKVYSLQYSLSTVGYICGFTASTIYLALLPHSALLSANLTPVSMIFFRIFLC